MTSRRNRPCARKGLIAAGVALAVAGGLAVVGKFYVFPRMLRGRIPPAVAKYWSGPARVEHIDFRYFGPIRLRGVSLYDGEGRPWMRADAIRVTVDDRYTSPKLRAIEIEGLDLVAQCAADRCCPPLKPFTVDLCRLLRQVRRFDARDARLLRSDDGGPERQICRLQAHAEVDGNVRTATVVARRGDSDPLRLRFQARPVGECQWKIDAGEADVARRRLTRRARMTVSLRSSGVDIKGLSADVSDGRLSGTVSGTFSGQDCMRYRGDLALRGAELSGLTGAFGWGRMPGTADANVRFEGGAWGLRTLAGAAEVSLHDVRLSRSRGFRALWEGIELPHPAAEGLDIALDVRLDGARVTIDSGGVTGALVAARIEPGGTVDLARGGLDCYVVVAALKDPPDLDHVPLARWLAEVGRDLSRQHVTGNWGEPEGVRVTPAPMAESAVAPFLQFLRKTVETGEGLTQGANRAAQGPVSPARSRPSTSTAPSGEKP